MFPKSIRWRIQAWHGFLLVCIVSALVAGFYSYERRARFREVDSRLHETISPLLPRLAPLRPGGREGRPPEGGTHRPPSGEFQPPEFDEPARGPADAGGRDGSSLTRAESAGYFFIVWDEAGEISITSSNAPLNVPAPTRTEFKSSSRLRTRGDFRELCHFVENGRRVLLGISMAHIHKELHQLAGWLAAAGLGVITIGLVGGWWMADRAIRPIGQISLAAERIAGGDWSQRIVVSQGESELGKLAQVLNQTFAKLEKSFAEQARFTADASHELRTPLAVILTQVQLARSRERSGAEYRQTLETCERAAERMRVLVNQLLELARMDTGGEPLIWESCDLSRVAREALEFIEPLARQNRVKLSHSLESVRLEADAAKLGQVIINLLNNAIIHNPEGVEVHLSIQRQGDTANIRVADNGVGLPAEALPHLFGRFYRVDKARSRGRGSSGLGLSISKAIVQAHRGTIHVQSEFGKGAQFIVELPLGSSKVPD